MNHVTRIKTGSKTITVESDGKGSEIVWNGKKVVSATVAGKPVAVHSSAKTS